MIYRTPGEHANSFTTDTVQVTIEVEVEPDTNNNRSKTKVKLNKYSLKIQKGVIRNRKSKKDIQQNDQKKKDKQRSTKHYIESKRFGKQTSPSNSQQNSHSQYEPTHMLTSY